MPIYEYECPACKERFEILQKMEDDACNLRCPKCQAEGVRRVISLVSSGSIQKSGGCSTGSV